MMLDGHGGEWEIRADKTTRSVCHSMQSMSLDANGCDAWLGEAAITPSVQTPRQGAR